MGGAKHQAKFRRRNFGQVSNSLVRIVNADNDLKYSSVAVGHMVDNRTSDGDDKEILDKSQIHM